MARLWSAALFALFLGAFHSVAAVPQTQQEEAFDYYRKWLEEDVVYIITDEERDVFLSLQNEAERDHFIEQFWRRRDPDPRTSINEFKEEHYRRITYANERFTAGVQGWRTDRGLIYIRFGPPNDIDDHPAGSTYVRPKHEGGGTTLVNPFQVWRYNHIEGIGTDIEIEFVDIHGGNLYRFANDELEKDALLYHPLGYTLSEQMMGGNKTERIITRSFGDIDAKLANQIGRTSRAKDEPFEKMRVLKELETPPQIEYQDLRRIVRTAIYYDTLPFQTRIDLFSLQEGLGLVPVSVAVPDAELTYVELPSGPRRATVEIYGMVTTLANQVIDEFELTVIRDASEKLQTGSSVAQKKLKLPPGRYKLSLVVRDANSGKIGTGDFSVQVPLSGQNLASSTLVLAERIAKATIRESEDPLVLSGAYKVVPKLENIYHKGQDVQIYLELYNFALDQSSSRPALKVDAEIQKNGKRWELSDEVLNHSLNHHELYRDRLLILKKLPTSDMETGDYRIVMTFEDQLTHGVTVAASSFRVVP